MEYDKIEKLGNSTIQHGKSSDRIYLMKLDGGDLPQLLGQLDQLAEEKKYTKIFAKVPGPSADAFKEHGYNVEAFVPGFYKGETDGVFLAKFFSKDRAEENNPDDVEKVLDLSRAKEPNPESARLEDGFTMLVAGPEHAEQMSEVYRVVFETYPFPIHEPEYIRETMETHVVYFAVFEGDRMVAVASSEMDESASNVEMTDFATLPDYRGRGLAVYLLYEMEKEMQKRGIATAYTIARAVSAGMNITFAKLGYKFAGTLVNNTDISGGMESMNVWYKPLLDGRKES